MKKKTALCNSLLLLFLIISNLQLLTQNYTFQSILGGTSEESYPRIIDAGNNELMVINRTRSFGSWDFDIMLTKLDSLGQKIWSKKYGDYQRDFAKEIYKTDYGYLLLLWRTHDNAIDDWHLIQIDHDGNILQDKIYGNYRDEQIYDLLQIENNKYIVASALRDTYTNACFSILDKNLHFSNIVEYDLSTSDEIIRRGLLTDNDQVLFCGYTIPTGSNRKPLLLGTQTDGNFRFMYKFDISGDSDLSDMIAIDKNEFIAVGYTNGFGGDYDVLIMRFKENGDLIWVKTIDYRNNDKAFDILLKSDSTVLITGETYVSGYDSDIFMINISADGHFLSAQTYGGSSNENFGFASKSETGQILIAAETYNTETYSKDIFIIKANEDGSSCCGKEISDLTIIERSIGTIPLSPNIIEGYIDEDYFVTNQNTISPSNYLVCYDPLKIIGRNDLCKFSDSVKYVLYPKIVFDFFDWIVPDGAEIINNLEDTAIMVNFEENPGYIYLRSKYCQNKNFDSLYINLAGPTPDLGNDTLFCSNTKMTLSPGAGYGEYLWQDGSTEPNYTAIEPGIYWVKVKDDSECEGVDSIVIDKIDLPNIDLGPDSAYLISDFYLLDAGFGFENYLWNDFSSDQTNKAYNPGQYWVVASIGECSGSDTINIINGSCKLLISNILTPNGDGISDKIHAIYNGSITHFELTIYNLLGAALFKTYDVNFIWDGKINGSILPSGTYIYTLKYLCPEAINPVNDRGKIIITK